MSSAPSTTELSFPWATPATVSSRPQGWRRTWRWILALADTTVVAVCVAVTFGLVLNTTTRLQGMVEISYQVLAVLLVLAWSSMLGLYGARSSRVMGAGLEEYRRVIAASLVLFGGLAIASYVFQASVSRALFVTTLPMGVLLLLAERWLARDFLNRRRAAGLSVTRTLVVGSSGRVDDLLANLAKRPEAGYRAEGYCVVGENRAGMRLSHNLVEHRPEDLLAAAVSGRYGAVIIADGLESGQIRQLAWQLERNPIELMFLPRLLDVAGPRMQISDVEGLSLVHVDLPRFSGWNLWLKRSIDIVFSSLALLLLSPGLLVIALWIKLDDRGPVFFTQQRVGLRGKPFTIHKFRTMCVDAEEQLDGLLDLNEGNGGLFKLRTDPRVTRAGRFLRKYSLDELPQFWTVLTGRMSVVGPRPALPREVEDWSRAFHRRLLIKPGITGLWQIGGRSDLSLEDSARLDLRYVENWSPVGDAVIILKTIRVVIRARGAY